MDESAKPKRWEIAFSLPGAKSRRLIVEAADKDEAKRKAQRAAPGARVFVLGEAR